MVFRVGDLNKRIELQSPTSVSDGMGGETLTWSTAVTVWGSIMPVSANEVIKAGAPTMTVSHRVKIRYYSDLGADWRMKFGDRYFSIVSIINPNEKNEVLDVLCKEVV